MSTTHTDRPGVGAGPIEMTLVVSAGCHLCDRAHQILESVAAEVMIDVREVDLESDEGQALQARWRAPFPPMLIVDGEIFGHGRISARKLMKHLNHRVAEQGT